MTDNAERIRAAFRLNLEQQKKQAKDLLKAAKLADAAALSRIRARLPHAEERLRRSDIKLADTQLVLARELGFAHWAELKLHIVSMDDARAAIERASDVPDADLKTIHLRCGSDIRSTLVAAGFGGDFLEVSYPYCHGPVSAAPDRFEREARFLVEFAGKHMHVLYERALARRYEEERALAASADTYERVVLWMEHDCFDQMVLMRCLAHFAAGKSPRVLELIGVNHFPGRRADGQPMRFLGLGQLPREAIRLLWSRRRAITQQQLALAANTWRAATHDDPSALAAIVRGGTPQLPDLAPALHRLLQELPWTTDGLSLTERLILQVLAEGSALLGPLLATLNYERDPLFFATDLKLFEIVERMRAVSAITCTHAALRWDVALTITELGRAVLRGERDWLSLQPAPRWVAGVEIRPGEPSWRWDDAAQVTSPPASNRRAGHAAERD